MAILTRLEDGPCGGLGRSARTPYEVFFGPCRFAFGLPDHPSEHNIAAGNTQALIGHDQATDYATGEGKSDAKKNILRGERP